VLVAGCSSQGTPLPQVVLVVDTDAPVSGQLLQHPEMSPDAAIDTVRVDVINGTNVIDFRDLVVSEPSDWPLSFGIAPQKGAPSSLRVRVRAFRGFFAQAGTLGMTATLEPPKEVTIDRLVDVPLPIQGVLTLQIVLREDCLGVPSSSLDGTTCVDADHMSAPISSGTAIVAEEPASLVGTWSGALAVPCAAPAPAGQTCIPGGFSILGELSFAGIADGLLLDSVPLRPVMLDPFYMDTTEFTVGRFRKLANFPAGMLPSPPSAANTAADPGLAFCTWDTTGKNDDKPVNCIGWDGAKLACSKAGGLLPSEAQWEHAARGRGQRRLYPWGDDASTCCTSSAARVGVPPSMGGPAVECGPASGIEPVGSHPASSSCNGLGDVSRDGVLDLAGSVSEALLDNAAPYSASCWNAPGIAKDPTCVDASLTDHSMRGGYWNGGLAIGLAPLRSSYPKLAAPGVSGNSASGFRCVYPGGS
jgi:formylglycine-generating enzyme required for sulfatase activity